MHSVDIVANPMASIDLELAPFQIETGGIAPRATATAQAYAPEVVGDRFALVQAVRSTAATVAYAPLVGGTNASFVTAVLTSGTTGASAPVVTGSANVNAVIASGTGLAKGPINPLNASVTAVKANSTSASPIPVILGEAVLTGGSAATASALASVPVVSVITPTTVAFDAAGAGAANLVPSGGVITWSHTCTGTNRVVIVMLALGEPTPNGDYLLWTQNVTYGGNLMQPFVASYMNNLPNGFVQLFYLFNPPTGAQTISTTSTYAPAGTPNSLIGSSVSYTGALSITNDAGSAGFTGGPNPSITVTSASGSRVIAATAGAANISAPSNTQRFLNNFVTSTKAGNLMVQDAAGAASVTMTATCASDWGVVGCSINPT